ncbi:hypothetical protein ES705_48035 [subsurface metagenome]
MPSFSCFIFGFTGLAAIIEYTPEAKQNNISIIKGTGRLAISKSPLPTTPNPEPSIAITNEIITAFIPIIILAF